MRGEVRELLKSLGTTTILVTHDHEEALLLGDRLVLLRDGVVVASGDPVDLYRRPPDGWSAGFLGEVVTLEGDARSGRVGTVLGELRCTDAVEGAVEVVLRPEELVLGPAGTPPAALGIRGEATGGMSGKVDEVAFRGAVTVYTVIVGGVSVTTVSLGAPMASVGDEVCVWGPSTDVTVWPATLRSGP